MRRCGGGCCASVHGKSDWCNCCAVRFLRLYYVPSGAGAQVLPVELLHGFTFALAWGTGTAFASKMSPPGLEATTQAAFQGVYFGA